MDADLSQLDDGQLLVVIDAAMDALTDDRLRLPTEAEQLELLAAGLRLGARLTAWQQQIAAGAERSEAAWHEHGTSTTTWLVQRMNLTAREAAGLIRAGEELHRFEVIGRAAAAGSVLPGQATAITGVLADLPKEFDAADIGEAQKMMVGFAENHNSAELRRLTSHLIDVLALEITDAIEAKRLERQERLAQSHRFIDFSNDGHGSVTIRGSLPVANAESLIQIVEAYAAANKRALDAIDPNAEHLSRGMRMADGLLAMVAAHTQQALAPGNGGDRPRIVVTLSYDKLVKHCADHNLGAHLTRCGEPLPASVARQLLCDADLLPVVLGADSQVLDVGRTQRLVTSAIRAALEVRDGGCVFPGCDKPPEACHAHHIVPWWDGGETSLSNLVMVCAHHHGIVEPGRPRPGEPAEDRWQVRLRDHRAEIIPPRRVDPAQRPRTHVRFTTRR